MSSLEFRVARAEQELAQLHALHYRAFVEEIPQHRTNAARLHVDRFHDENTYVIAVDGEHVVGSVAIRSRRPFSLDGKLPNLDSFLPAGRRWCEIRLLNVVAEHRSGPILPGLLNALADYALGNDLDAAVISATTRQLRLYKRLGFVPFGPLVGTADAQFQPMYLTLEALREHVRAISSLPPALRGETVDLLSGPVAVHADVRAAFETKPEPHRSAAFEEELRTLKERLCNMTRAPRATIFLGSGTLANDVVAAQLATLGARGLVISNGEFGERLADHAHRAGMDFHHLRFDWGAPIRLPSAERHAWVWMAACETSTGVLNELSLRGTRVALDCVSAIGAIPLDLSNVWLASGASGKALASYPGLSTVFSQDVVATPRTPRYLDLSLYARHGVPFTHSSNLVRALNVAVGRVSWTDRYAELASTGAWLRARLHAGGCSIVGQGTPAPHVITVAVRDSMAVARALEQRGFLVAHGSSYLRERNWIQICLMGEVQRGALPSLVRELSRLARAV